MPRVCRETIRADEEQAITAKGCAGTQSVPDSARRNRKRRRHYRIQGSEHPPGGARVRHCDDESHGPRIAGSERIAFELGRAQLGLEVDDRPLDFDLDPLRRMGKQDVSRAAVARCDLRFKGRGPCRMDDPKDRFRHSELPGVAEP